MRILTAEEMRCVDRVTAERFGVPSHELMENAGRAVARFVLRELPHCLRVIALCGKGNNGGDGFVAARYLAEAGRQVEVVVVGEPAEVAGDARRMLDKLAKTPHAVRSAADFEREEIRGLFAGSDVFLDAVLGAGFHPPMRELATACGQMLLRYPEIPVVAVDVPSGWNADSRSLHAEGAFRADAVVTFTAPKPAHIFGMLTQGGRLTRPGNLQQGPVVVAAIGSPAQAIPQSAGLRWSGSSKKIVDRPRPVVSNKGLFGHVLVIGGGRGKTGAPAMTSYAALRAGAGLVTAAVPASAVPAVAGVAPELMTLPLLEGANGEIAAGNLAPGLLEALLERKTAIALGPGIGQEPETAEFVLGLLDRCSLPMVVDADALNILARHPDRLLNRMQGRGRVLVFTPHPGEMARLCGNSIAEVEGDREGLAREFSARHHVTLVLKGWRTLIAHPDGGMAVNTTGNPGMAKGGSGDILTGILAALLAQHPEQPAEAVNAAVYLHGLAADCAVRRQDQHTLLAMDTVSRLYEAFGFAAEDREGQTWLQGLPGSMRPGL
jgi:NAD(P)H-hydrate epimerase